METKWIVFLAISCLLQAEEPLGRHVFSRIAGPGKRPDSSVARMLGVLKRRDFFIVVDSTTPSQSSVVVTPTNPSVSRAPPYYDQNYLKCTILENLLPHFFKGFPNIAQVEDSLTLSSQELKTTFSKTATEAMYMRQMNYRISPDQMIEELATLILDQRMKCSLTMYQGMFVYAMEKNLNKLLADEDGSLKSQFDAIFLRYFPGDSDYLAVSEPLVQEIHNYTFASIIEFLQHEEFKALTMFLETLKSNVEIILKKYYRREVSSDDLEARIEAEFRNTKVLFPRAMRCPTPEEFIHIHKRGVKQTTELYFMLSETGFVAPVLASILRSRLMSVHSSDYSFLDYYYGDTAAIDSSSAVSDLATVAIGYTNATMYTLAEYEGLLGSDNITEPPQFILDSLDSVEYVDALTLYNRIFRPPVPSTTSILPVISTFSGVTEGLSTQIGIQYLEYLVSNLKRLRTMAVSCQNTTDMEAFLDTMIADTEDIINSP